MLTLWTGDVESSDDESSEIVNNGETDSSSTDNGDHDGTNGVTNRVNGSSTDSEEEVEENDLEKHDDAVHDAVPNGNNGFTVSGEPEFKPKKVSKIAQNNIIIGVVVIAEISYLIHWW